MALFTHKTQGEIMTVPLTIAQIDAYDKLIQANGVSAVKQV
jgi:hypothetical protein